MKIYCGAGKDGETCRAKDCPRLNWNRPDFKGPPNCPRPHPLKPEQETA